MIRAHFFNNTQLASSSILTLTTPLSRRQFVRGSTYCAAVVGIATTGCSRFSSAPTIQPFAPVLTGKVFDLSIGYLPVNFIGSEQQAIAVNGSVPAPTLRWREGDTVTIRVTNYLAVDTSIHWHGIILPSEMDGVPGMSYAGIKPGETFTYQFPLQQSGTYWYHSHSGFQEATGLFGAIVIEPKMPEPTRFDSEHVVLLSDWSYTSPETLYANLKKQSGYYNYQQRTAGDLWRDVQKDGIKATWSKRAMWNQMRMSDHDISDAGASAYTYLMNGVTPAEGWRGVFKAGEKVRLRFINGSSMTIFDVRIPGLKMTVVAADGQAVQSVTVDEFRLGVAETYDVVVEPASESAYTIFAQNIDRTGYARGTLAARAGLNALIPALDPAPVLSHADMGMGDMQGMDHSAGDMSGGAGVDHSTMDMSGDAHSPASGLIALGKAGFGSSASIVHAATEFGAHVDARAMSPISGLHDPGLGLRDNLRLYGRKVLNYGDLHNLYATLDPREPTREIQLHLTGNMHRYQWSINGLGFMQAEPVVLKYGERVRFLLVNDTMMTHPIHLHGLWSELETGDACYIPRKHTVLVQPGASISYLVTANSRGRWAYHCHLLMHMLGMMREVRVV